LQTAAHSIYKLESLEKCPLKRPTGASTYFSRYYLFAENIENLKLGVNLFFFGLLKILF